VAASFQPVIDCADPEPLARFWAAALGYELEPPPDAFASWNTYRRDLGVPEDELGTGADCIVDPGGRGPRIWFQAVPERKAAKNRLHLDIGVSGGRAVPRDAQAARRREAGRLAGLGALLVCVLNTEGPGHYAVAIKILRATSSTSIDGRRCPGRPSVCQRSRTDVPQERPLVPRRASLRSRFYVRALAIDRARS
jgi:Glyoxalase-like domain